MVPIIEINQLTKRYRGAQVNAVDAVSFEVAQGEFFTLLGPNGAGKTTTISILTTTQAPTSGYARIAGHDLAREPSEVRQNVGIIFQQPSLDMNLTGEENIRFHATLYGLYPFRLSYGLMPKKYRQQVDELAVLLGLEGEIFKPVKKYSGGMRRKLEIMRSLLHRPRVLFLDEPTAGLDPISRRSLWEYLRQVRRESGTTIFLTTHYLDEAEEADSVCILNHGRVITHGSPAEVKSRLVEHYLLIDSADHEALRTELTRQGIGFVETPQFKIDLNHHSVQDIIKSIDTPLNMVKTHVPTLEDAYLEIVGQS